MKTIRKNNQRRLRQITDDAALLAVYKGDGYYPIDKQLVLSVIDQHQKLISSALLDESGRLTIDITDRKIGQYILALPSLEYARTHLYPKDFARLHPDNELSGRSKQHSP